MTAPRVIVETHLAGGLPGFTLVGLPETAVREARDRVKGALVNCGYDFPAGRVVVNLAPADLLKEGGRFDLAIAISILRATGQLRAECEEMAEPVFLGELSLSGELRVTRGCVCAALAIDPGQKLVVPFANAREVQLASNRVVTLAHLKDVVNWLTDPAFRTNHSALSGGGDDATRQHPETVPIIGQSAAKRALALAAAGGHHLLMVGPPGTGKSLLARRLPSLLPPLSEQAALEVAAVYSAAGVALANPHTPPFRDPHHSVSTAAMVGGGHHARPGEISLAHHGVLFLDELPHFKPSALDCLREPLETRSVSIVRANWRATFPASFQLLAAMNPCPAGQICSPAACRCRPDQVLRYRSRVSGPLLDRIDLHVPVPPVPKELLLGPAAETHAHSLADIQRTRQTQHQRQGKLNCALSGKRLEQVVRLGPTAHALLEKATDAYQLSARGFYRVLRVARTIADLDAERDVATPHLAEALSYRSMNWDGTR
jgi:magnesium chelatase family protein